MQTREWRDRQGDALTIKFYSDGEPLVRTDTAGTILTRPQVEDLYLTLGQYLAETGGQAADTALPTITAEAEAAVYGDRQDDYGHPREDFTRTAIIWTGLLHHKLADGVHLEPEDVARLQIGVKLARDVHSPKRDNRVDMAGYALTLDRLETGR